MPGDRRRIRKTRAGSPTPVEPASADPSSRSMGPGPRVPPLVPGRAVLIWDALRAAFGRLIPRPAFFGDTDEEVMDGGRITEAHQIEGRGDEALPSDDQDQGP